MATDSDLDSLPNPCRKKLEASLEHPRHFPELLAELEASAPFAQAIHEESAVRRWELCALEFIKRGRFDDAVALLGALYDGAIDAQGEDRATSSVKGTSLVWLSHAHLLWGHPALAQRYTTLTLCEDAIGARGKFERLLEWGGYWRARIQFGASDHEIRSLIEEFWSVYENDRAMGRFPEWILQNVDERWSTVLPATSELGRYKINQRYAAHLLIRLGTDQGRSLELLAQYLLSCVPGWRTRRRAKTYSTDYDVVCTIEGPDVDFRADIGRFVICECKDWSSSVGFTEIAKFARVLESAKCQCGILLSRQGITGGANTRDAARELLKVYQDTGIAILVVNEDDLRSVVDGANFIRVLRDRYEHVRLDIVPRQQ